MKMKKQVLKFAVCILVLAGIHCGPFHCSRSSQPCPPGVTCNKNGTCACPSHLQGDDCSIVKADITETNCKCKNGVCVKKGSDVVCACSVFYYGEDCSEKRYKIKCSPAEMIFNVNPVGTYTKHAFVLDKGTITQCHSHPVPNPPIEGDGIPDTWQGQVLKLMFNNSTCGKINRVPTSDENVFKYDASVKIEFGKSEVSDVLTGTCYVTYSSHVEVTAGIGVSGDANGTTTTTTTTTTTEKSIGGAAVIEVSVSWFLLTVLTTWRNCFLLAELSR